eukprot:evm.model.scf_152.4 EVM.evm.TU.scf_152.4   scf_152:69246-72035(-)
MYQMDRRASELVGHPSGRGRRFRTPATGLVGHTFSQGASFNLRDAKKHNFFDVSSDTPPGISAQCMLLVPVLSQQGAPIGLIQVANKLRRGECGREGDGGGTFSARDVGILGSLAVQVAVAVENCQAFALRMEKRSDAKNVPVRRSTFEAVRDIVIEMRDKLNCEGAKVHLVEEGVGLLCSPAPLPRDSVYTPMHAGIAGKVATSGESVNLREARADPDFDRNVDSQGLHVSTMMAAPVVHPSSGAVLAVAQALNKRRAYFDVQDERYLEGLAARAAASLANARLHDEWVRCSGLHTSLAKHVSFLAASSQSVLRLSQAAEDMCNELLQCQSSALMVLKADGTVVPPNTLGGKDFGTAKHIAGARHAADSGVMQIQPAAQLQVDEYSGQAIKPHRMAYVPLNKGGSGKAIGVMCLQRCSVFEMTELERTMLASVARRVEMHLEEALHADGSASPQ